MKDVSIQNPSARAFALSTLNSTVVTPCIPWEFKETPPDKVRGDKNERDAWINNYSTKWQVYSLVEGLNENRRIRHASSTVSESDANPPHMLHGLVADYDAPISDADWEKAISEFFHPPQFVERTLSGNLRCIWTFEQPLLVPGSKFLRFFLENLLTEFRVDKLLPAFDKGAWGESNRYYTNSGEWFPIAGATPLPADLVRGWMVSISNQFSWVTEAGAVEIPFEVLRPALESKYPRYREWPGDFALGTQGPTFWIDDSTSPKSAIVRETGIQTFASHASQSFYSWADLIGYDSVKSFKAADAGRAVEDIYHDGKFYFRKLPSGAWKGFTKNDIQSHLKTGRGVSGKRDKAGNSDIDRAIEYIHDHQSISGKGSFVFSPPGIINIYEKRVLNDCVTKVLTPSGIKSDWGSAGKFPFISRFLDGFFDPPEQLPFLISWLKRFYMSGLHLKPASGQNMIIAGKQNVGKTFLSQAIIGALVGGETLAEHLMLGKDNFGAENFAKALWTIDDGQFGAEQKTKRHFTLVLKQMAANPKHRSHEKFGIPVTVSWQGRVIITCNDDAESIQAIPDLSGSILDKLMIFRTGNNKVTWFPDREERDKLLAAQLPHFAQYLLDYEIPAKCQSDVRFGVQSYNEASIVRGAEHSSSLGGFVQLINLWHQEYFKLNPKEESWKGSELELRHSMTAGFGLSEMIRGYGLGTFGRLLPAMKGRGHQYIDCIDDGDSRIWVIQRNKAASAKTENTAGPELPPQCQTEFELQSITKFERKEVS